MCRSIFYVSLSQTVEEESSIGVIDVTDYCVHFSPIVVYISTLVEILLLFFGSTFLIKLQ